MTLVRLAVVTWRRVTVVTDQSRMSCSPARSSESKQKQLERDTRKLTSKSLTVREGILRRSIEQRQREPSSAPSSARMVDAGVRGAIDAMQSQRVISRLVTRNGGAGLRSSCSTARAS